MRCFWRRNYSPSEFCNSLLWLNFTCHIIINQNFTSLLLQMIEIPGLKLWIALFPSVRVRAIFGLFETIYYLSFRRKEKNLSICSAAGIKLSALFAFSTTTLEYKMRKNNEQFSSNPWYQEHSMNNWLMARREKWRNENWLWWEVTYIHKLLVNFFYPFLVGSASVMRFWWNR